KTLDAQPDPRPVPAGDRADLGADLPRARVLDDVVEGFLRDPVQDLLDGQRQTLVKRALDTDRKPEPALERGGVGPQRPAQSVLFQGGRTKLEDQSAHLRASLALEVAQLGELGPGRLRIAVEEQFDRTRYQRHREERLGHRIVELARQVGTLLARPQLTGLAAPVAV